MKNSIQIFLVALSLAFSITARAKDEIRSIDVTVTEDGFVPSEIKVKPDSHVVLNVTRKTDMTCATQIKVKEKNIKENLDLNKTVKVDLGVVKKGSITFSCGMNMVTGHVVVE